MALVGNTFYQASSLDPGFGFPMYYWNQTNTGLVYIRNAADTAWILVGDSAQPYLGQLSTQGGGMNGAISGLVAAGVSARDTNDFTTLYVGGIPVATKTYVDTQDSALSAQIATSVSSALAQIPSLNLSTRTAKNKGRWGPYSITNGTLATPGLIIPLPAYGDGVLATPSECIWGVSVTQFAHSAGSSGGGSDVDIAETTSRVYTLTVTGNTASTSATVDWWIIAFRGN
jgi:hypothetical protein